MRYRIPAMPPVPSGKLNEPAKQPGYHPPLVISIHGIRTRGAWQKLFDSAMSASPTKVESFDYGTYGLLRFLTPACNRRMVERFYHWYTSTMKAWPAVHLENYADRPSVVAHSLGS